jgi:hypothetical protein
MARTEHLPIYKTSYALCLFMVQLVHAFSSYHQYTLGLSWRSMAGHNTRGRRNSFQSQPPARLAVVFLDLGVTGAVMQAINWLHTAAAPRTRNCKLTVRRRRIHTTERLRSPRE